MARILCVGGEGTCKLELDVVFFTPNGCEKLLNHKCIHHFLVIKTYIQTFT